jgi:DNA invertase Pin-like site-specific DNA recombinase
MLITNCDRLSSYSYVTDEGDMVMHLTAMGTTVIMMVKGTLMPTDNTQPRPANG